MCRSECPCKEVDYSKWSIEQQQELQMPASAGGSYDFSGSFESFTTCYQSKIVIWNSDELDVVEQPILQTIETLETNLNCSGIC